MERKHKKDPIKELSESEELTRRKKILRACAKTKSGRDALRLIMELSGFKQTTTSFYRPTHELRTENMLLNEGLRLSWIGIRELIPIKLLNEIEKEIDSDEDETLDEDI